MTIDRDLNSPVYEQIANRLRRLIASGELGPGLPLPSVRRLAEDLGVNLNTVARAYRRLEDEGFLIIRERAGVTVAAPAADVHRPTTDLLLDELRLTLARLRQAGMSVDQMMPTLRREVLALGGRSGAMDRR
jgi:GntR family transcriptional regulator